MTQIICLANSWKNGGRCIAGIDPKTSQWIRPVSDLDDGRILSYTRLINQEEPRLLDILEIPLSDTGPDFGFQSENRSIISGKWQRVGQVKPEDIFRYCESEKDILHNKGKAVPLSVLKQLPLHRRRTLQLVPIKEFEIKQEEDDEGNIKWRASLVAANGAELEDASITDPVFVEQLNNAGIPDDVGSFSANSVRFATVSLGMPWQIPNSTSEPFCYKLIAGIIEI